MFVIFVRVYAVITVILVPNTSPSLIPAAEIVVELGFVACRIFLINFALLKIPLSIFIATHYAVFDVLYDCDV